MKKFLKWGVIGILATLISGCGDDVQTEVSKCEIEGHKDVKLTLCMSAKGYDYRWEKSSCVNGLGRLDYSGECFEKRGAWRSTKLFFKELTAKQN